MATDSLLDAYTTVLVRNLPKNADEAFLERYFRSHLKPVRCDAKLVSHSLLAPAMKHAFIDLGAYEKVQQAVRELNGQDVDGQRILVSVAIRKFSVDPGKKVYLKKIPTDTTNADLYDLLSKFGTIVSIEPNYDRTDMHQLFSACAIYLSVKDAQHAIQMINLRRQHSQAITASPDIRYVPGSHDSGSLLEQSEPYDSQGEPYEMESPPSRSSSRTSRIVSFATENEVFGIDEAGSTAEATLEEQSLTGSAEDQDTSPIAGSSTAPTEDMTKKNGDLPQEAEQRGEVHVLESPVSNNGKNVAASSPLHGSKPDLSSHATEDEKRRVVHDFLCDLYRNEVKPPKKLSKILQVLRDSLDPQHLLDNCIRKERFQLYIDLVEIALKEGKMKTIQLSEEVFASAEEMELATMSSMAEKLQTIRENLFYNQVDRYGKLTDGILDKLLKQLDIQTLFELCVDQNRFRLLACCAQMAMVRGDNLVQDMLPDSVADLILNFDLDKPGTEVPATEEWKQAVRTHLMSLYEGHYNDETLCKILDKLFQSSALPTNKYDLLELCTNEKKSRLLVFHAIVAMEKNTDVVQPHLSDYIVENIIFRNNLDKETDKEAWNQAIRSHLITLHEERYGGEKLNRILDKMFQSTALPTDVYDLLELCTDEKRFRMWAFHAKVAILGKAEIVLPKQPTLVMNLIVQLSLDQLSGFIPWKLTLHDYLLRIHHKRYGATTVDSILKELINLDGTSICDLDIHELLESCADADRFFVYAFAARLFKGRSRSYTQCYVSDALMKLNRQLVLDKLETIPNMKKVLREHLLNVHQGRILESQLARLLDKIFEDITEPKEFIGLFEVFFADADRICVYATIAEFAVEKGKKFTYEVLFDSIMAQVKQLDLVNLTGAKLWMQKLQKHFDALYESFNWTTQERENIIGRVFIAAITASGFYRILQMTADKNRLQVYIYMSIIAKNGSRSFEIQALSDSAVNLALQLNLNNLDRVDLWEEALKGYLEKMHQEQYKSDRLNSIKNSLFNYPNSTSHFYRAIELCADKQKFMKEYPPNI